MSALVSLTAFPLASYLCTCVPVKPSRKPADKCATFYLRILRPWPEVVASSRPALCLSKVPAKARKSPRHPVAWRVTSFQSQNHWKASYTACLMITGLFCSTWVVTPNEPGPAIYHHDCLALKVKRVTNPFVVELDMLPCTCSISRKFDMYFLRTWPLAWARLLPACVPGLVSNSANAGWFRTRIISDEERSGCEDASQGGIGGRCAPHCSTGSWGGMGASRLPHLVAWLAVHSLPHRLRNGTAQLKSPRHTAHPVANHIIPSSPCRKTTRSRPTRTWR